MNKMSKNQKDEKFILFYKRALLAIFFIWLLALFLIPEMISVPQIILLIFMLLALIVSFFEIKSTPVINSLFLIYFISYRSYYDIANFFLALPNFYLNFPGLSFLALAVYALVRWGRIFKSGLKKKGAKKK